MGTRNTTEGSEKATLPEVIRSQLDRPVITVTGYNGTFTLTPEQGRKVLAGGELVVKLGKVVVR